MVWFGGLGVVLVGSGWADGVVACVWGWGGGGVLQGNLWTNGIAYVCDITPLKWHAGRFIICMNLYVVHMRVLPENQITAQHRVHSHRDQRDLNQANDIRDLWVQSTSHKDRWTVMARCLEVSDTLCAHAIVTQRAHRV